MDVHGSTLILVRGLRYPQEVKGAVHTHFSCCLPLSAISIAMFVGFLVLLPLSRLSTLEVSLLHLLSLSIYYSEFRCVLVIVYCALCLSFSRLSSPLVSFLLLFTSCVLSSPLCFFFGFSFRFLSLSLSCSFLVPPALQPAATTQYALFQRNNDFLRMTDWNTDQSKGWFRVRARRGTGHSREERDRKSVK